MSEQLSDSLAALYDRLAVDSPGGDVRFLNYGWDDGGRLGTDWLRPADESDRLHLNLVRHLVGDVDLEDAVVVEIGSGRGGNCAYLRRYTRARRVVGVDRCFGNVALSCRHHDGPGLRFLVGDAQELPLGSETADVVLSIEASHCYPDLDRFLGEVSRVLRPGGVFCFTDLWGLGLPGLDWSERAAAFECMGLVETRSEDIGDGVRRALEHEGEGVFRTFDPFRGGQPSSLRSGVLTMARELRTQLAAGACTYPLRHFRKPAEGGRR